MADDSDLEKTEQPTQSKIDKAKEKGQIPRSKELTSVMMLAAGVAILWMLGHNIGDQFTLFLQQGMRFTHADLGDQTHMLQRLVQLVKTALMILLPIFAALVVMALVAPLMIGGLIFSGQSLIPDFKRLNPIKGLGRVFSARVFAELLKGVMKVTLVALIIGFFLFNHWPEMLTLSGQPLKIALDKAFYLIFLACLLIVFALMPMIGFDVFYQIWSNLKKLKMSKQEIRDEYKEQEGDPQIKSRIRQQQRAIAQRRMMSDVPQADVIVTNPTHYAVALQYSEKTMAAPKVLAKGSGMIALRIKELGNEHKIPQLEAPPLARALYRHSEIGQSIPTELYAAVAQVLAWVHQLRYWKRIGGPAPVKPDNLPVPKSLDFDPNKDKDDEQK